MALNDHRVKIIRESTYGREVRSPIAGAAEANLQYADRGVQSMKTNVDNEMKEATEDGLDRLEGAEYGADQALEHMKYDTGYELDETTSEQTDRVNAKEYVSNWRLEHLSAICEDKFLTCSVEPITSKPGYYTLGFEKEE